MKRLSVVFLLIALSCVAQAQNALPHLKQCAPGFAPTWQKTSDPKVLVQKCYKYGKPIPGKPVELVDPVK